MRLRQMIIKKKNIIIEVDFGENKINVKQLIDVCIFKVMDFLDLDKNVLINSDVNCIRLITCT